MAKRVSKERGQTEEPVIEPESTEEFTPAGIVLKDEVSIEDFRRLRVRFTGKTPLLQHNPASMRANGSGDLETVIQKGGKLLSGAAEAEAGRYPLPSDPKQSYHPAEAFRNSMIEAVAGMKIGKQSATDLFMRGFFHVDEYATLCDPSSRKPLKKYTVDTRTIVNPTTGGRSPRSRPRWDAWMAEVEFEYLPAFLTPQLIISAGKLGGVTVGIGEYRPKPPRRAKRGKGGRFGRYEVEIVE